MKKKLLSVKIIKIRDKWFVICEKKKVSVGYENKTDANDFKKFYQSR